MLNFGLVGCGRIGIRHATLLSNMEHAKLTAVCDIDEKKAIEFSKKFNVPFYTDYMAMAKKETLDVINICTPSGFHAKHTIDLVPYIDNIIVEKPMALKLEDADNMINTCKKEGTRLFIVKQNRFNLPIIKLREAVEKGRFGRIYLGTVRIHWRRAQKYYDMDNWHGTWSMDGGVLTNQSSHHIDMLQWMLGPIKELFAYTDTFFHKIEVEDTGIAVLRCHSGAMGTIEATTNTSPEDLEGSINIYGEKGTVEIGGFAMNKIVTWKFEKKLPEDENIIEKYSVNPPNVYGFGHKAYLEHVVDSIMNNKAGLIDGAEGKKSLEIIHSIYESAETGKPVIILATPHNSKLGKT